MSSTQTGNIGNSQGVAVGDGATAVHIDAMGNVGDVITVAKMNLINQTTTSRVASTRQIADPPDSYITRSQAEEELSALLTAESSGFHIVHLYGLPGVGKSWLARKVAKGLEDHFEHGTLWANLEHTKFRTAVKHFIEPYDQTINHNSLRSNSEYVAAMTEAFADRRILIVLDQLDGRRDGSACAPRRASSSAHRPAPFRPRAAARRAWSFSRRSDCRTRSPRTQCPAARAT